MNVLRHLRREWLLVAEIVILGLFAAGDASETLKTLTGLEIDPAWVLVTAIVIIGATALVRLGNLRDEIDSLQERVQVTARLVELEANLPDPGPDKQSLRVHVSWDVWVDQDVSTDRLALNLIYLYQWPWWQFWKRRTVAQTGIPTRRAVHSIQEADLRARIPTVPRRGLVQLRRW